MLRYFMNISYLGTPFRGAQRQCKGGPKRPDDPLTIQGRLEMALKNFKPLNVPIVALSSRTDKGVHAINSTCHVDLLSRSGMPYDVDKMKYRLNKSFLKNNVPIRVLGIRIVPESFHCQSNAISRTYLYRILLAKTSDKTKGAMLQYMPIEEWDRCTFYCVSEFDLDMMREAAKLMEGHHDFRTFMKRARGDECKITRKTIHYVNIMHSPHVFDKLGCSPYSWPRDFLQNDVDYSCLDIYIKGKGFLYNQVRDANSKTPR